MSNKKNERKELERFKDKFEKNQKSKDKKQFKEITNNVKTIKNTTNKNIEKNNKKNNNKVDNKKIVKKDNHSKNNNKGILIIKQEGKLSKEELKLKKEKLEIKNRMEVKKKKKKKRIVLIVLLSLLLIFLTSILVYHLKEEHEEKIRLENIRQEKELIEKISSHYNIYVKTNKEAMLYNSNEEIVGKISSDTEITLKDITIDKNTKYFEINDFEGYYLKYEDVEKINSLSIYDTRYKKYIVFNENIVTNDITSFYDGDNNLIYEFNTTFDLPIIVKDIEKYGVEFNNRLLYIKNEDVKEVKYNHNTDINNASGVAVLNYHAFYDESNYEERSKCVTSICHSKAQFKTHLDYLKENNILTLKMDEIEMYIDGKIQLPKSVLITIDDGPKTEQAVNMLTEYEMYATIFLITDWFDEDAYYKTDFIELHSHTHDLHDGGVCPGGQGGAIKCLDRKILLDDLKQSREELNGSTALCYPFYEYNSYSIEVAKEAGFTMAFAGYSGNGLVKVGADKFRLPRYVITTSTTISGLNYYFNQIKN